MNNEQLTRKAQIPLYKDFYEDKFVEYLADWINLHKKNETADTAFKNSIVIYA